MNAIKNNLVLNIISRMGENDGLIWITGLHGKAGIMLSAAWLTGGTGRASWPFFYGVLRKVC